MRLENCCASIFISFLSIEPSVILWFGYPVTIQYNNTLLILKKEIQLSAFDKY